MQKDKTVSKLSLQFYDLLDYKWVKAFLAAMWEGAQSRYASYYMI
jgi:hypothetical protein